MSELPIMFKIQAILFALARPVSRADLASSLDLSVEEVSKAVGQLEQAIANSGIHIACHNDEYTLVTAPEASTAVRAFLTHDTATDLSKAALETLAIVAYRGPLTKTAVDTIRGVASDTMIRNLIARGLVEEAGRASEPGKPMRYCVTHGFLQSFGLSSTKYLPHIPEDAHAN